MTRSIGTVAVLLLLLTGCHARPVATAASSTETITVDGRPRTFHLYRPATLANPAPLVLMLHGGFGDGAQAESACGWDAQADRGHFLVAYPDGLDRAWSVGGDCCGIPGRTGVD